MMRAVSIVSVALACLAVTGCGKKMSKSSFDKVQIGMSQKEVEAILGKGMDITNAANRPASGSFGGAAGGIAMPSGTESSGPSMLPGISHGAGKVMQWEDDNDRIIQIVFVNEKVSVKQQKGL